MKKVRLGKTATSRTRGKKKGITEQQTLSANQFINYLLQKGYSNTTANSFNTALNKFLNWLETQGLDVEEVQYNDITAYLSSLVNISQQTKSCYLQGVKQYFNHLIHCNERADNPVEFIQLKGIKRKTLYNLLNRQELDKLYNEFILPDDHDKNKNQNWFKAKMLVQKRNKIIVGLLLYQGLDSRDLRLLTIHDVKLKEGKIFIPGTRRSNERILKLDTMQILDMMEYLFTVRAEFMLLSILSTDQLFISTGGTERIQNIMVRLVKKLYLVNPKITSVKQLKASVIVHWLKIHNLRQVQYMAGHRYVSSTEGFLANEMEGMIDDIEKYHPQTNR